MADSLIATSEAATSRRGVFAAVGAVGAALLASLCCVGPLVFVAFGVGAGLASTLEPLRPLFTVATVALLALGFYVVYGRRRPTSASVMEAGAACGPGASCTVPRNQTRDRVLLWVATVLALVFLTFPQWSLWFVG